MFPTDMEFDIRQEAETATAGISLQFDFTDNSFVVTDGAVNQVQGIEAVKQWAELFLRTRPGVHPVYKGINFGVDLRPLINRRDLPEGVVRSEFERVIKEGMTLNPHIEYVDQFQYKRKSLKTMEISFCIHTKNGERMVVKIDE